MAAIQSAVTSGPPTGAAGGDLSGSYPNPVVAQVDGEPPMALQAATAVAGYAKINGTGNIITWTAPNDGKQHRVVVVCSETVTTGTETGGAVSTNLTAPGGGTQTGSGNIFAAAKTVGTYHQLDGAIIEANTTFSLVQSSALSAGGPTSVWAEIWGS